MGVKQYLKRGIKYVIEGLPKNEVYANVVSLAPNELLVEQTALITGGTSGIGKEIASSFIRAGAEVIITGRSEERCQLACDEISQKTGKNNVKWVMLDNSNVACFKKQFEQVLMTMDSHRIDTLVNNAGLVGGEIRNCTEEKYDSILDTNLKGAFFLSQLVGQYMKENHIKGHILNIGSSSSLRPATSAYTISKWGIYGFTKGLAKILAPYGITVNGIAPGPTATPMLMPNGIKDNLSFPTNPLGRFILPEEIANMAVFLVSEMGRSVIGDMVFMTGGSGVVTYDDVKYYF